MEMARPRTALIHGARARRLHCAAIMYRAITVSLARSFGDRERVAIGHRSRFARYKRRYRAARHLRLYLANRLRWPMATRYFGDRERVVIGQRSRFARYKRR